MKKNLCIKSFEFCFIRNSFQNDKREKLFLAEKKIRMSGTIERKTITIERKTITITITITIERKTENKTLKL